MNTNDPERRLMPNRSFVVSIVSLFIASTFVLSPTATRAARLPAASGNRPDPDKVLKAQTMAADGKVDEAVKTLTTLIDNEKDHERRSLARMALAVIDFQAARDAEAEAQFQLAIEDGTRVPDYAHFYLGVLKKRNGKLPEAAAEFSKVVALKGAHQLELESKYLTGEILIAQKQWKAAAPVFESLKKAYRSQEKYPDVLYNLVRADLNSGRKPAACKPARELYSKYPSLSEIHDWTSVLSQNSIDGIKIGCNADAKELKTRIRRLWLGGDAERATAELKSLRDVIGTDDEDADEEVAEADADANTVKSAAKPVRNPMEAATYGIEAMLANHLLGENQVDEAMKLLLKHYQAQHLRPSYLSLLAKASARAGEYQAAIASFQKAFDLSPRGKDAANNLFQAAFTSYQIQDYDGATRRFEKLIKAFPNSRLSRDARWHLAWMRYLRSDYEGAYESFAMLSKAPKVQLFRRRGRHGRLRAVPGATELLASDRIQYWSAMSLLRLHRTSEAVPLFQALVKDPAVGYYSLLAYSRLVAIPGANVPAGIEVRLGLKKRGLGEAPSEEELKVAAATAAENAQDEINANEVKKPGVPDATEAAADTASDTSSDPTPNGVAEPSADATTDVAGTDTKANDEEEADASADSAEPKPNFKDPQLAIKFERAHDLAFVGLEDGARRELGEIERRARSVADRHLLMNEYAQVRNYERSSIIGEMGFGAARLRDGFRGESRQYWEYSYPKAWETAVEKSSRSTSVPQELIWGIMRAESHYRQDAASPVGALGLMQLMPFTGRKVASLMNWSGFETRSLLEPETNIRLGSRYLQRLQEKFSNNVALTAAGYNAGPHRVHAWIKNFGSLDMDEFIEHIPFLETRNYVKRVVRNFEIYGLLYKGSDRATKNSLKWLIRPVGVELKDSATAQEIW